MSETFQSFGVGGALQNQPRALAAGDYEHLLKRVPPELLKMFSQLAESGIFGEGGVEKLQASVRREGGLRRNALSRGLKQRLGRRLGPRSGAIDTMVANQVYAPSFAGEEESYRNLTLANQQSKMGGLSGISDLMKFFQSQFGMEEELKQSRSGPGLLDLVGAGVDIASLFAAPATGGASLAVPAARRQMGGGYGSTNNFTPSYGGYGWGG